MTSGPINSWQIDMGKVELVEDIIFLGFKITADGDWSHEINRHLPLGRKVVANLDSVLKSRDITLPIKVHIVKAMLFPVVMCFARSFYFHLRFKGLINKISHLFYGGGVSTSCDLMDYSLPDSSIHGIFQARILEWVAISSPGDLPDPGIEPRSPALRTDSLPTELWGKPSCSIQINNINIF